MEYEVKDNHFILFFSITFISSILILISQIGFDYDFKIIFYSTNISIFIYCIYDFINFSKNYKNFNLYYLSDSFSLIFSFLFTLFVSLIANLLDINIIYLILLFNLYWISKKIIKTSVNININNILILILFIIFSIWCVAAFYEKQYFHPLILEKIITGAYLHRDPLWHSSMSGMLKTYGISSTGLDGFITYYYHSFSHYIYGILSSLVNTNTMIFYSISFPIIIIPMFFLSFILAAKEVNIFLSNKNKLFKIKLFSIPLFLIFFFLFCNPLPIFYIYEKYQYISNPSYCFALIFTFFLIILIFSGINNNIIDKNLKIIKYNYTFILLFILLFFIISLTKFSFLYFILGSYFFFFIRFNLYKQQINNIVFIIMLSIVTFIYFTIIYPFQTESEYYGFGNNIISLFKDNTTIAHFLTIIPSILYIYLRLFVKFNLIKNFKKSILDKRFIDIEYLIYISIILAFFPYPYTKGIQVYIAYILIISNFELLLNFVRKK